MNTYVVEEKKLENSIELRENKKTVIYVTGVLTILLIGFTLYNAFTSNLAQEQFISTTSRINELEGVIKSGASKNTTTFYSNEESTTVSYSLLIWVTKLPHVESI